MAESSATPTPPWAQADNVPEQLRNQPQWLCWNRENDKDGKPQKKPKSPHDGITSSPTAPSTWGTYEEARAMALRKGFSGVGISLGDKASSSLMCVDLDHVLGEDGELLPQCADEFQWLNDIPKRTYVEVSPSGNGLHIWFSGKLAPGVGNIHAAVELYGYDRYMTFTGDRWHDSTLELEDGSRFSKWFSDEYSKPRVEKSVISAEKPMVGTLAAHYDTPGTLGAAEVISMMCADRHGERNRQLLAGDTSDYDGDESRADQALCNVLAFYTGKDPIIMDAIFRQSGLMREKWDRKTGTTTYGAMTIQKAIDDTTDVYSPQRNARFAEGTARLISGRPRRQPTIDEVAELIRTSSELNGIGFWMSAGRVYVTKPLPWNQRYPRPWDDGDRSNLAALVQRKYGAGVKQANVDHAFSIVSRERDYSPIRDGLESLPEWDGERRMDFIFSGLLNTEDSDYTRAVAHALMCGIVERGYCPGTKFEVVPVIVGEQGIGKSTTARMLAFDESLYTDHVGNIEDVQQSAEQISDKQIVEVGELAELLDRKPEVVKAFISRTNDECRGAYGRYKEQHPRSCVFIATTNSGGFLTDLTGSRRFYPIECPGFSDGGGIFSPDAGDWIRQAYAETLDLRRRRGGRFGKEDITVPRSVEAEAERVRAAFAEEDPVKDAVLDYLRTVAHMGATVSAKSVFEHAPKLADYRSAPASKHRSTLNTIRTILDNDGKKLGWHRLHGKVRPNTVGFPSQQSPTVCWEYGG